MKIYFNIFNNEFEGFHNYETIYGKAKIVIMFLKSLSLLGLIVSVLMIIIIINLNLITVVYNNIINMS